MDDIGTDEIVAALFDSHLTDASVRTGDDSDEATPVKQRKMVFGEIDSEGGREKQGARSDQSEMHQNTQAGCALEDSNIEISSQKCPKTSTDKIISNCRGARNGSPTKADKHTGDVDQTRAESASKVKRAMETTDWDSIPRSEKPSKLCLLDSGCWDHLLGTATSDLQIHLRHGPELEVRTAGEAIVINEVCVDASAAISFAQNIGSKTRMKHIDIRESWVQQLRDNNKLQINKVDAEEQRADPLTKVLERVAFKRVEHWLNSELNSPMDLN